MKEILLRLLDHEYLTRDEMHAILLIIYPPRI